MGGSYVGPTQDAVLNLIQELGLSTYLVEDSTDMAYLRAKDGEHSGKEGKTIKSRRCEFKCRNKPECDLNFGSCIHWLDYVNMIKLIDSYGSQIPHDAPWMAPKAREWDSKTFKQFVDENSWTQRVRDYFNNVYVQIDVCCEASEISMLWFLWYVKQCGGYGRSISTTNGGQERKILNGSQQLSKRLQESLGGSKRVLLSKPVCHVQQSASSVTVRCTDGSKYEASYLILAMPPHLWLKMHYEPSLPAPKMLLAQRSPMGTVGKLILYYKRAFWRDHDLSGCFMIESESRRSHPVILTLDDTKPDNSHPAIIGFIGARGWFEMKDKSDEEVARIVAQSYIATTGLGEFEHFIRFERGDWCVEQYSGGCYTSTHPTNTLSKYGKHLREPFRNIYFAGTETATQWSGYMDGAIRAGKRAAREILHTLGRLEAEDIWKVEPESQLIPRRPFEYPASHRWAPSIGALLFSLKTVTLTSSLAILIFHIAKSRNMCC